LLFTISKNKIPRRLQGICLIAGEKNLKYGKPGSRWWQSAGAADKLQFTEGLSVKTTDAV